MKKSVVALCLWGFCSLVFAQGVNPCEQKTALTGGTEHKISTTEQSIGAVSGTDFEYELWHNITDSKNEVSIKVYGANQGGGAAFRGEWNEQNTKFDYLARIGYKFEKSGNGSGKLYTEYDNIYADYNYTRSERPDGDNYSYIGIYGWARAGNNANLVEYYIVDDWWGNKHQSDNTPVGIGTTSGSEVGTATIDGGTYKIIKNTRTNEPSIEGNKTFDQYFSVRQTTRKCGTISITEHFKAWENLNLKLGKLVEAKILAEIGAYNTSTTTGWIDYTYATMRMGGSSSSSSAPTNCITLPANPNPPADPYNTCFKHTNGNCYKCVTRNEGDGNTCSSTWVWDGNNVDDNLELGYWYDEVPCNTPTGSSSSSETTNPVFSKTPLTHFSVRVSGKALLIEANSPTIVEIYDLKGNKAMAFNAFGGSQTVNLPLPNGVYFAKARGMQSIRFVLK